MCLRSGQPGCMKSGKPVSRAHDWLIDTTQTAWGTCWNIIRNPEVHDPKGVPKGSDTEQERDTRDGNPTRAPSPVAQWDILIHPASA